MNIEKQIKIIERKANKLKPFDIASRNAKSDLHKTHTFAEILIYSDEYTRYKLMLKHLYIMKLEIYEFDLNKISNSYLNE